MSFQAPYLFKTGTLALDSDVFDEPFRTSLVHETIRAELNARRRGTAATKTRGKVRGGGIKPWRQKGTGRARAGSIRSPLWRGGGTVFGPSPRSYTVKVNRKARKSALRSALALHAKRESIAIITPDDLKVPSTKQAFTALDKWASHKPVLVVVSNLDEQSSLAKSFRNIEGVQVIAASDVGVTELVRYASLVITELALESLVTRASQIQTKEAA